MKDGKSLVPNGENRYHAIFGSGPAYFVSASSLGPALDRARRQGEADVSARAAAKWMLDKFFVSSHRTKTTREIALAPNEILTEILIPTSGMKNATYEVREKDALDWPLATARLPSR